MRATSGALQCASPKFSAFTRPGLVNALNLGLAHCNAPLVARMKAGEVRVRTGNEDLLFYVSGGLFEVQPHVVTVLADTASRARDLDEAAALKAKERAEEALRNRKMDIDYAKAQAELAEAIAQLRTIQKLREHTRK